MSDQTSNLIGICWIPNISGKVSTTAHLNSCFGEKTINVGDYTFNWDSENRQVIVHCNEYNESKALLTIRIVFIDDSGLCYIYSLFDESFKLVYEESNNPDKYEERNIELSYHVMEAWNYLREMVDSSSSPMALSSSEITSATENCVCNAMNWPIPFDESKEDEKFKLILEEFILRNEDVADTSRYVSIKIEKDIFGNEKPDSIKRRMCGENTSVAIQSMNSLYMDSFISIYSDCIDNASKYQSQDEFRARKAGTISAYNRINADIQNLCVASSSMRTSKWGIVIAILAVTVNIATLIITKIF